MDAAASRSAPVLLVKEYRAALGVGVAELADMESAMAAAQRGRYLAARLPVESLALGSVAAVGDALGRFLVALGLEPHPLNLDTERIAASFASDRLFRVAGDPVPGFAPLSGFTEAADGWLRTHANYPHHRARLCACLGLADDVTPAAFAERISTLSASDVEDAAARAGAIATRVRSEAEWAGSPQGRAAVDGPLVRFAASAAGATADGEASRGGRQRDAHPADHYSIDRAKPLAGVRVLDLTRVIAGPVATRTLALLGAEVLRIDSPRLPEIEWQHTDSGQGKRSSTLDLATPDGRALADRLLERADVLVTGYRPGAIEALGLSLPPGVVHATVDAWGTVGPWGARRGFDSIVQAASGIALIESPDGSRPGALPAQALDHASGYLLAAATIDALAERLRSGRGAHGARVGVSLARTAEWLLRAPGRRTEFELSPATGDRCVVTHDGVTTARPALAEYDGYAWPAHPLGADAPAWLD